MKISFIDQSISYVMNEDGQFECIHDNVCIERACCNGNNCACSGIDTIYCADCDYVFDGDEAYDIYMMNWSLE